MSELLEHLRGALAKRYVVEREVGCGGMAVVFLAHDVKLDRRVAIKVLRPELVASIAVSRFLHEIQIAAPLTHPHIVPVHDAGEVDGLPYFVMPFVDGESLRTRLTRQRTLPVREAVRIAREVADALAYAHRRGIVHRDIKPENILLTNEHAVVADFGIATALDRATAERFTPSGSVLGTLVYMSPEGLAGDKAVDGRSDQYSLGCVLHEMLTGTPPVSSRVKWEQTPLAVFRRWREAPPFISQAITKALARSPAERFSSAEAFREALTDSTVTLTWAQALVVLSTVAFVVVGWLVGRTPPPRHIEPHLLAIAPFDLVTADAGFAPWREGLVISLYYALDDLGQVRTLAPSVSRHAWEGPADVQSALAFGRRTHAGLVVYGRVTKTGADSVRVTAALLDVMQKRVLGEADAFGTTASIAQITTALTLRFVRHLPEAHAARMTSAGTASPEAFNAFVRAEQFYYRTEWDSAMALYRRAVELDSAFALAERRLGLALSWQGTVGDSGTVAHLLSAGVHNRGLAPRESLLVAADSQAAAADQLSQADSTVSAPLYWATVDRLFSTLRLGKSRYPHDPEFWYGLGEAGYHHGAARAAVTATDIRSWFDSAIALDSGFAPAYLHPIEIGLQLGGEQLGAHYITRYLALNPSGLEADGARVVARVLNPLVSATPETERALMAAPNDVLAAARNLLDHSPDSLEAAVRLNRLLVTRVCVDPGRREECVAKRGIFAQQLAYRGHAREASQLLGKHSVRRTVAELAMLGAGAPDSISPTFDWWLSNGSRSAVFALPWWASRSDSTRIRALSRRAARTHAVPPTAADREYALYEMTAAQAYLALVRSDSADALRQFASLPDTLCFACYTLDRLTEARLIAATGRPREALEIVREWRGSRARPSDVLAAYERGVLAETLGETDDAAYAYALVIATWRRADAELQHFVSDARAALARLRPRAHTLTTVGTATNPRRAAAHVSPNVCRRVAEHESPDHPTQEDPRWCSATTTRAATRHRSRTIAS
jgi:hypothetical protein